MRASLIFLLLVPAAALARGEDGGAADPTLHVIVAPELAATFVDLGDAWTRAGNPPVNVAGLPMPALIERLGSGASIDLVGSSSHALDNVTPRDTCSFGSEQRYARGRLALWVKSGTPPSLLQLEDARWQKIAIGQPNLAPYGRAANQALEHAGLLTSLMPRLVYRPDSAAALSLAREGKADAALVALSLVADDKSRYTLISSELYTPIEESLVSCADRAHQAAAKAFVRFILSPSGAAILKRHALDP